MDNVGSFELAVISLFCFAVIILIAKVISKTIKKSFVKILKKYGYEKVKPVEPKPIPIILQGYDIMWLRGEYIVDHRMKMDMQRVTTMEGKPFTNDWLEQKIKRDVANQLFEKILPLVEYQEEVVLNPFGDSKYTGTLFIAKKRDKNNG